MMKYVVMLLLSLTAVSVQAQGKIFFPETSYDFGAVAQGKEVSHEFEVENRGAAPLNIIKAVAQCGCTASTPSKDVLQPGEKGVIKVLFDTSNFSGEKEKTVTVYSNDPQQQMAVLTLRGHISPGVRLAPDRIVFGEVIKGTPVSQRLVAEVADSSGLRVVSARTFSKHLNIEEKEASPGRTVYDLSLGDEVPLDEFRARVGLTVQGTDGKIRELDVPVFAIIKGTLSVSPPALSLGILEGREPIKRTVKLEYRGPGAATIRSIETTNSHVRASSKETQKGKVFLLNVEADPTSLQKDLRAAVTVIVRGDDDEEESVSFNVYGTLPPS